MGVDQIIRLGDFITVNKMVHQNLLKETVEIIIPLFLQ